MSELAAMYENDDISHSTPKKRAAAKLDIVYFLVVIDLQSVLPFSVLASNFSCYLGNWISKI